MKWSECISAAKWNLSDCNDGYMLVFTQRFQVAHIPENKQGPLETKTCTQEKRNSLFAGKTFSSSSSSSVFRRYDIKKKSHLFSFITHSWLDPRHESYHFFSLLQRSLSQHLVHTLPFCINRWREWKMLHDDATSWKKTRLLMTAVTQRQRWSHSTENSTSSWWKKVFLLMWWQDDNRYRIKN